MKFCECGEGLYVLQNNLKQQRNQPRTLIFAQTVNDFEKLYTPRQVQRAKDVRELQRRLAYPPQQQFEQIIKSHSIINCPFTVDDVRRSYHIYGPIIEALKGKTTVHVQLWSPVNLCSSSHHIFLILTATSHFVLTSSV